MEEARYNNILESFANNWITSFARVLIVNLSHKKLPKLILVVCCTCNCFDVLWIWNQWSVIDKL